MDICSCQMEYSTIISKPWIISSLTWPYLHHMRRVKPQLELVVHNIPWYEPAVDKSIPATRPVQYIGSIFPTRPMQGTTWTKTMPSAASPTTISCSMQQHPKPQCGPVQQPATHKHSHASFHNPTSKPAMHTVVWSSPARGHQQQLYSHWKGCCYPSSSPSNLTTNITKATS